MRVHDLHEGDFSTQCNELESLDLCHFIYQTILHHVHVKMFCQTLRDFQQFYSIKGKRTPVAVRASELAHRIIT